MPLANVNILEAFYLHCLKIKTWKLYSFTDLQQASVNEI
jgi:hypothetical protein